MKVEARMSIVLFILIVSAWVESTNVPSCATMRTWFPGTSPLALADNLPYELSVSGRLPGDSFPTYYPNSPHIVYLNGSYIANEMRMRNFLGFIISAENSVKMYPNGHFENLPAGVEQVNCSTLKVVQNSTSSGNWTSVKLLWRAPKDGHLAGNITFRASALLQTNPLQYFEGFTAHLGYRCPMFKCVACPSGSYYVHDSYGCQTCQCGGPCANMTCPFYGNCVASKDHTTAECNCDIVCAEIYDPVCGTDGRTHSNACAMRRHACTNQKNITVSYKGECNECPVFKCRPCPSGIYLRDESGCQTCQCGSGGAAGILGTSFPLLSLMLAFLVAFLWLFP